MPKTKQVTKSNHLPMFFILGGLVLLVLVTFLLKSNNKLPPDEVTLESQLDQALQESQPIFVFLHSTDCIPCQEMMEIVDLVYPEYEDKVVLIDVDVYDPNNENILREEALQAIPTLVFYDRSGERSLQIGVLPADQLRIVFQTLSGD